MYRHILVAVDLSDLSQGVVQQAIALAQGMGAKLTFLHVLCSEEVMSPTMPLIPVPEYYPSLSTTTLELYQEEWNAFESKGLGVLEAYRTQAEAAGLQAECLQRSGHPGSVICSAAADLQVDLIAIGRRGYSGLSELLLGSVSNYVVHHATSAVLVCNVSKAVTGEGTP
ncbi:MAG: universal stress protein [Thermosynechococcaceae cyanobacterium]